MLLRVNTFRRIFSLVVAVICLPIAAQVSAADKPLQSIVPAGMTPLYAQTLDWIDATHFALGRWDGTISVFRTPGANEWGPVVTQAMALPSGRGVEMIVGVDSTTFVSSDGRESLAVWHVASREPDKGFQLAARLAYAASFGPATSGIVLRPSGQLYLITGHENGSIIIWQRKADDSFELLKSIDVKSPNKPANPFGIHHIRGLAAWKNESTVITGSEDGDLVGVTVPAGTELFRVRYNQAAKLGINNISTMGNLLLVANCAVGPTDKNLWLFDLSSGIPVLSDAENLVVDLFKSQVFNFDADLAQGSTSPVFLSSTEEGLLWMGQIEGDELISTGVTKSSPEGGSIIDISPAGDLAAVVTYAVRLYRIR